MRMCMGECVGGCMHVHVCIMSVCVSILVLNRRHLAPAFNGFECMTVDSIRG